MTAMAHEPVATDAETLLEGFLALETPTGFRAELLEGEIVVTPPTDGDHEDYLDLIDDQVRAQSTTRMQFVGGKGLKLPGLEAQPADHVVPDATIAPREKRVFRGAPPWMPAEGVGIAMVVEVTSSNPQKDRVAKRRGYARAGIPLYLLVDRHKSTATLFSEPDDGDYRESHSTPLGKAVPLPAPFSFDLDTSDFV